MDFSAVFNLIAQRILRITQKLKDIKTVTDELRSESAPIPSRRPGRSGESNLKA